MDKQAIMQFPFYRQWNGYSCGAAVLRMGIREVTGNIMRRKQSEIALGCKPHGVSMSRLQKEFRNYGVKASNIVENPTEERIRQWIEDDKLVVIDDDLSYDHGHVVMLPGMLTSSLMWYADPLLGFPILRTLRKIRKHATQAFAVS